MGKRMATKTVEVEVGLIRAIACTEDLLAILCILQKQKTVGDKILPTLKKIFNYNKIINYNSKLRAVCEEYYDGN